jgi:glycosyl transferase, family 25
MKPYIIIIIIISIVIIISIILYFILKKNYKGIQISAWAENFVKNSSNNLINDYVDAVLIINLEKDKQRYKDIYKNLIDYNINKDKIYKIDAVYNKISGHLGCGKSHVKAIEFAIKNNFNNILILEDDFEFTSNIDYINNILQIFFDNFKNWNVLDLEKKYARANKIKSTKYTGIHKSISTQATGALIINKNYYNTLLQNRQQAVDLLQIEHDNYLKKCKNNCGNFKDKLTKNAIDQWQKKLHTKDNWYVLKPHLGTQLFIYGSNTTTFTSEKYLPVCPKSLKPKPIDPENPDHISFADKLSITQIFLVYCANNPQQSPKDYNNNGGEGDCPGRKHVFLYQKDHGGFQRTHKATDKNGKVIKLKDLVYDVGIDVTKDGVNLQMSDVHKSDKIEDYTDNCNVYKLTIRDTDNVEKAIFLLSIEEI